ncbi:hypothetical protein HKX48_006725, partial [Thoreauomyces humboldtii]
MHGTKVVRSKEGRPRAKPTRRQRKPTTATAGHTFHYYDPRRACGGKEGGSGRSTPCTNAAPASWATPSPGPADFAMLAARVRVRVLGGEKDEDREERDCPRCAGLDVLAECCVAAMTEL